MLLFLLRQLGDYLHKAVYIGKFTVNGGEADIGYTVDVLQLVQHHFAYLVAGHLTLKAVFQAVHDVVHHILHRLQLYGTLYGGSQQPVDKLLTVKGLDGIVLFYHHQRDVLNYLIGGETAFALQTLSAAAYFVFCGAGVDDLAVVEAAFGTLHSILAFYNDSIRSV